MKKHANLHHQLAGGQQKIYKIRTKPNLSDADKVKRDEIGLKLASVLNVGADILEKPIMKEFMQTICELSGGKNISDDLSISRTKMRSLMTSKSDEFFQTLALKGPELAKAGLLTLKTDHVYTKKFRKEGKEFFALALTLSRKDMPNLTIPLSFRRAASKTHHQFLKDCRSGLEVSITVWAILSLKFLGDLKFEIFGRFKF